MRIRKTHSYLNSSTRRLDPEVYFDKIGLRSDFIGLNSENSGYGEMLRTGWILRHAQDDVGSRIDLYIDMDRCINFTEYNDDYKYLILDDSKNLRSVKICEILGEK